MHSLSLLLAASAAALAVVRAQDVAFNASSPSSPRRALAAQALSCSLQNGVDFLGNDVANVQASAASDCCAKCSAQAGCNAFTWTNFNGGTCWLKSKKGATAANAAAQSAEVSTTSSGVWISEPGVDYVGNDVGNVAGASADVCQAKCAARADCGAYTWTNYMGGACWLKSAKGATKANAGASSGVLSTAARTCPTLESNTDYTGTDIGNVQGNSAADCCAQCSAKSGCNAFTWTSYNFGTCWLKSGKGAAKTSTGAVSAVLSSPDATTPAPTTATPSPSPSSSHIQPRLRSGEIPLRSVNLGGWLVAERWMSETSPAWVGVTGYGGEYDTMKQLGKTKGTDQFEQHRATWITETDIQQIAAAGMNAVRVPVGFWIVDEIPGAQPTDISRVYAPGALKYLDMLINDWAVKYNLAVMLSLHAHQGSQNGYDHSAPQVFGAVTWSDSQANVDNSLQFSTLLAARYKDSVAFLGMNLMNEPMYPLNFDTLRGYYLEAYKRIRATGNNCVLVVSPRLWDQAPPTMEDFMRWPAYTNVWHEFHVYYKWTHEGKTEAQIMDTARPYRETHLNPWTGNWIHMGEWSLAAPDSAPFQDKETLKQYAAIQLANYEGAHSGWSFWSWRHDEETTKLSGWSLRQLLREGIFTIPRVN